MASVGLAIWPMPWRLCLSVIGGVSVLAYGGVGLMTTPVRKPFISPVMPWRFRPSCPSKIHSRTVTQCCCLKLLPITMDACWRHVWQPFVLFNYSVIHCLYLALSLSVSLSLHSPLLQEPFLLGFTVCSYVNFAHIYYICFMSIWMTSKTMGGFSFVWPQSIATWATF